MTDNTENTPQTTNMITCPFCQESIKSGSIKCRYCQSVLVPLGENTKASGTPNQSVQVVMTPNTTQQQQQQQSTSGSGGMVYPTAMLPSTYTGHGIAVFILALIAMFAMIGSSGDENAAMGVAVVFGLPTFVYAVWICAQETANKAMPVIAIILIIIGLSAGLGGT